jgi:hypothetical protein
MKVGVRIKWIISGRNFLIALHSITDEISTFLTSVSWSSNATFKDFPTFLLPSSSESLNCPTKHTFTISPKLSNFRFREKRGNLLLVPQVKVPTLQASAQTVGLSTPSCTFLQQSSYHVFPARFDNLYHYKAL